MKQICIWKDLVASWSPELEGTGHLIHLSLESLEEGLTGTVLSGKTRC